MLNINNTLESYLQNVEIKGNTIQNPNDLVDIKSVGDKVGDEELYRIPIVCCGANINSTNLIRGNCNTNTGVSESGGMTILITSDFLKVPENTTFSYDTNGIKIRNIITFSYDADKKYIGYENTIKSKPGAKFIKVRFTKDDRTEFTDKEVNDIRLSINVGEQSIPYEDYKEHKITILSPVQLEKVGDVTDRIIEKDGVWGVEKNNISKIGLKFTFNTTYEGWNLFECVVGEMGNNLSYSIPNIIYEGYKAKSYDDRFTNMQEGEVYTTPTTNKIFIISKKDLNAINEETINRKTIIIAKEPRFIPLPNNQQIKLRTFTNKTNISFLTEIEGTIKADVAKSISASVKSNTQEIGKINNRILDLEGLKESQEITYETDKGYLVCKETKNGTVKDLKVKGKSLVNIALDSSKVSLKANPNGWRSQNINHDLFQVGKNYVLKVFNISEVESPHMYLLRLHYTDNTVQTVLHGSELINGVREKEFTIQKEINYIQCATNLFTKDFSCDIVIVNSDDSKYVNDYFEGIASVGNGTDKIEVSSIKSDGNLFNGEITSTSSRGFSVENIDFSVIPKSGVFSFKTETKYKRNSLYLKAASPSHTRVIGLVSYNNGIALANYNLNDTDLDIINQNPRGLRMEVYRNDGDCDTPTNICINKGESPIPYQCYKEDKKPLLFKDVDDTWKPISELRSCPECADSVELSNDGKYYYYIRTEKRLYAPEDENNPKVITDKTNTIAKLAKEKVFEVNPLFLESYDNETMILCESGAVKPGIEWKITSYITNLVSTNTKRIKRIENDFYNYTVSQNRMMLSSRYNADRADFRIDNTLGVPKTVSVELDYDLFELMKKVVIVGKDNYDRSKIEEQMDFYVTEGFIDWDMWDELFAIIELQHNPPVDLIPIEPISIEEPKPKESRRGRKKR